MPTSSIAPVTTFKSVFKGREDDFAIQSPEGGYAPARRALTDLDVMEHLQGEKTIGIYLIEPEVNTVYHTVLDLDTKDPDKIRQLMQGVAKFGLSINDYIFEFSGSKGYHIWIVYCEPIEAAKARQLGKVIVRLSGLNLNEVEVFPKQDRVSAGGHGNLVKLPLGVHQKSGLRSEIHAPIEWTEVNQHSAEWVDRELNKYKSMFNPEPSVSGPAALPSTSQLPCVSAMLRGVGEGCRDNACYQLIIHLRRTLDEAAATSALLEWNKRNKPPMDVEVIRKKVRSVWNSPAKGYGCDKDWMQQFCNVDECPVHAKAKVVSDPIGNGQVEQQESLLKEGLPHYGFLREFVDYGYSATDAPEVMHMFGGIAALSAAVGRKVYLPFGDGAIYPNTWIVIIAKSSLFHKSTALAIPQRLLWAVNEDLVLPNEFSPEMLAQNLAKQPNGIFFWSEIKNALKMMTDRSYMANTKEWLTELYDCPDRYVRKLKNENFTITNPTISILAATTMEWLVQSIRAGDIEGGFTARFCFVPCMAKSRDIALPEPTDKQRRNMLAKMLHDCSSVEGEVDMSRVRKMYEDWYYKTVAELRSDPEAEKLSGFFTRLTIYTLKFAMLLELSKTQDVVITEETMAQAIAITDYLKRTIRYLMEREFHTTREAQELEKLFRVVEGKGAISYRELLQRSHMTAKTVQPLLDTLVKSGRVRMDGKLYIVGDV
jgi:hypothetical protein